MCSRLYTKIPFLHLRPLIITYSEHGFADWETIRYVIGSQICPSKMMFYKMIRNVTESATFNHVGVTFCDTNPARCPDAHNFVFLSENNSTCIDHNQNFGDETGRCLGRYLITCQARISALLGLEFYIQGDIFHMQLSNN